MKRHNIGIMQGRLTPMKGRGIQFFPFDNWREEFQEANEIGLDEIEFIFDFEHYEKNPLWTLEGICELRNIMEKTGVVVNAVCFDYFMRRAFFKSSNKALKEENEMILKKVLFAMKELNIPLIEIPLVDDSSIKKLEEKTAFKAFISEIAREEKTLKFGLETDFPPIEFSELLDEIGLDNVGANYDSGNSSGLGYNHYEEVTTLRNRIYNIHIKDRKLHGGTVQLGAGSADFNELFRGLKEISYNGNFILQAARGEEGLEKDNIVKQKKFVESYINEYAI